MACGLGAGSDAGVLQGADASVHGLPAVLHAAAVVRRGGIHTLAVRNRRRRGSGTAAGSGSGSGLAGGGGGWGRRGGAAAAAAIRQPGTTQPTANSRSGLVRQAIFGPGWVRDVNESSVYVKESLVVAVVYV